mgnify:CR=1 FL=1
MSRVGAKPVDIPAGVTVTTEPDAVVVKGRLGELRLPLPAPIEVQVADGQVRVVRRDDSHHSKSCHGLVRNLIANMIVGVTQGYKKELEIQGVGYKAALQGRKLVLSLGFASPVTYEIPEGVKVTEEEGGVRLVVSGIDKQLVGDVAARIKAFFPAEPYKGKGIRLKGEYVRRKVGKTVA